MLDDQSNSDLIDLNWDHLDPFEQFRTRLFLLQSAFFQKAHCFVFVKNQRLS